ncbi:MAG TPA: flagellar basal-body MS-ring/collar protein FliF, partial [Caldilineaceae bacterium]|nr:flagellar basal-body MS-ring/collar protein FliF [Caldilineaceae bacterium]
ATQVAATRLSLASKNLPTSGTGYELFDKDALSGIGMTDFMQRMNFQRALEGEIARTITSIDGVEMARVHIAIPEESLFAEQQKEPTASVVLKLGTGVRLGPTQVQAIRFLLANSVEGMKAANISVVDMAGNLYEVPESETDGGSGIATSSQIETERSMEVQTQRDLQMMLDSTLGNNSTVVRINVELNWDREESVSEEYAPAGQVGSVVRSNQQSDESWTGVGADPALGVPGVDANAPVDTPNYPAGSGDNSGEYNKRTSTTNYEVSKRITNSVKQPGSIKRMTVAVLVNEALPAEQVETVRALVAAAVGINQERGDLIQVERVPFNDTEQVKTAAYVAQIQQQELYLQIGIVVAVLLGLGMILFFIRRTFADMQKRMIPYIIQPEIPALPGDVAGTLAAPLSAGHSARSAYGTALEAGENEYDDFLKLPAPDEIELRLRAVARHTPETVASILQVWAERKEEDEYQMA